MLINVSKMAQQLKISLPDLITRPVGRRIYAKVVKKLEFCSEGEVVILDFEGIKVIDSSFIDEFIVKLLFYAKENKDVYFKLLNLSNIAEINISSLFETNFEFNSRRFVMVTGNICANNNFFIGELDDIEKNILDYIRVNENVTMDDLVEYLGEKKDFLLEKMSKLNSLRVVRNIKKELYYSV